MTTPSIDCDPAECAELLEMAWPPLYQRNLFRLLGLSVTADPADARREQKRLEMQRKLGVAPVEEAKGALSLDPPPTEEDIQSAMDRLTDPKARLLDELFWFWPADSNAKTDEGIQAIRQGDIDGAREFWTKDGGSSKRRQVAGHNLAILDHLLALEIEAKNSTDSRLPGLWNRAYTGWQEVLDGEEVWSRVRDRIRHLNDASLTTGFARRLQSTLPKAILLINARMALAAAEHGDTEQARRRSSLVQTWKKNEGLPSEVLSETLSPIRHRIEALCDTAEQKTKMDTDRASVAVWDLLTDGHQLLEIVDTVVPADHPIRQTLHDGLASTALDCQIAYGNKTNNWVESLKLLEAALALSVGSALRERIERNLEIVRELEADSRCFFCNRNPGSPDSAITVRMHGNVHKVDTGELTYKLAWQHATVEVPRCPACKRIQGWMPLWKWLGIIAGGAVSFGVTYLASRWPAFLNGPDAPLYLAAVWVIIVAAGFVIANYLIKRKVGYHVRPVWHKTRSPSIKHYSKQGWTFGEDPTDAEKAAAQYTHADWTWTNRSYKGEIRNGKQHGVGTTVYGNGTYTGEYTNGLESGGWYYYDSGGKEWCCRNEKGEWVETSPPPNAPPPM